MGSKPTGYSASRAASIIGLSKYQTPLSTWQLIKEEQEPGFNKLKNYEIPKFKETSAIRWGNAFEDAIIGLAERKNGMKIINREELFAVTINGLSLTCHIDGMFVGLHEGNEVLHEGKTTNNRSFYSVTDDNRKWGDPGTDQVPEEYQVQAQVQMFCTGAKTVKLSVLVFDKQQQLYEDSGLSVSKFIDDEHTCGCHQAWGKYAILKNGKFISFPYEWANFFNQIGNFHEYIIYSHAGLQNKIIKKVKEFDEKFIKTGIPPDFVDNKDIRRILTNPIGTIIATEELKIKSLEYSEITRQIGSSGPAAKRKEQLKIDIVNLATKIKKEDWIIPPDKLIIISEDGGDILATINRKGFRAKRITK